MAKIIIVATVVLVLVISGFIIFALNRRKRKAKNVSFGPVGVLLIDTSNPETYGIQLALPDMETIDYIVKNHVSVISMQVATGDLSKRLTRE